MKKVSVSIEDGHVDTLDERQKDGEATSRSDALRRILNEYEDLRTEYDDVHTECEELRTRLENREHRIDELEGQLARRSQVEEKVDVLAKRVDNQNGPDPPFFVRWAQWWRSRGDDERDAGELESRD